MQYCMDTAWGKCTCCNRCGSFCPFGIDMGIMFGYLRGLCYSQNFIPWELKIGSGMHRIYRAQMNVTNEEWVETCEWMAEEQEEEWPDFQIPIDKENADVAHCKCPRTSIILKIWLKLQSCFTLPVKIGQFRAKVGKKPALQCLQATGKHVSFRFRKISDCNGAAD